MELFNIVIQTLENNNFKNLSKYYHNFEGLNIKDYFIVRKISIYISNVPKVFEIPLCSLHCIIKSNNLIFENINIQTLKNNIQIELKKPLNKFNAKNIKQWYSKALNDEYNYTEMEEFLYSASGRKIQKLITLYLYSIMSS